MSHTHRSATGVVFSSSRLANPPTNEETEKSQTSTVVGTAPNSAKGSPASSIHHDAEKGYEEEELADYLVPALEKGVKNARLKPPSLWIQFRVWYNPYRMVCL